jgi:hypothetical protein
MERLVTHKRRRFYLAHSLLVALTLLQSCSKTPAPHPPSASDINDAATQPSEPDGNSLAQPAPGKTATPPTTAPAKPAPPEVLPESVVSPPEANVLTNGLKYDTVIAQRPSRVSGGAGWQYRKNSRGQIVGFEFSNRGGNRILPERHDIARNRHFSRDFQFRFDDRARQDIHFGVTDWVASRDKQFRLSELMNSVWLFFPRRFVPAIAAVGASSVVTLPTGEKVEFDARTNEIVSGVFAEAPVSLTTPRFPAVEYFGEGIAVRADARGRDPRIATVATVTTGSRNADCAVGQQCNQCQVPAQDLWEQTGAARFKFSTDQEFDRYLRARCGFGLPQATGALAHHVPKESRANQP